MRFVFRKDRFPGFAILALLAFSFLLLVTLPAVKATSPVVNGAVTHHCSNCLTDTVSPTVTFTNDVIIVTISIVDGGSTNVVPPQVSTITDSFNNIFSSQIVSVALTSSPCNAALCYDTEIWTTQVTNPASLGLDTITVTNTGGSVLPSMLTSAIEVSNVGPQPLTIAHGECYVSTTTCLSGTAITTPLTSFIGATLEVGSASNPANTLVTVGASYTLIGNQQGIGANEYSLVATSPTTFPFVKTGGGLNYWVDAGAVFGASTLTTTTVNTMCMECGAVTNSTTIYSITATNRFVFQTSQNTNNPGIIDEFKMKIAHVRINSNAGKMYFALYSSGPSPPGAGSPYKFVSAYSMPIYNNSVDVPIDINPQAVICGNCYYAVGIFTNTTASRGSGASGAGIAFYETSYFGVNQYKYDVGASTLPANFFSNTLITPNLFMYVHVTYAVFLITTSVTSTLTVGGTATTTTTSTSVVTTIDSTFFLQNANYPLILFVLMIPTGIFLGVTKNIAGALVGMMIGAVILIVLIPELRWVFGGLVIAIVALAFFVTRGTG